jgi:hypothetical protein
MGGKESLGLREGGWMERIGAKGRHGAAMKTQQSRRKEFEKETI